MVTNRSHVQVLKDRMIKLKDRMIKLLSGSLILANSCQHASDPLQPPTVNVVVLLVQGAFPNQEKVNVLFHSLA